MIRKNKNAFTLVELLAVIVILAIILVIAVPKVMNVIEDSKKASLESSAKMVAAQVENQYTVAQTLGKPFTDTGSCIQEWAGLNENDYASCTYEVKDGEAKVTIGGKGKFEGLSICNATRSEATAIEGKCGLCPEEEATLNSINVVHPYEIEDYDSCVTYMTNIWTELEWEEHIEEDVSTLCSGEPIWEDTLDDELYYLMLDGDFTEIELIENDVIKGTIDEEKVCVPDYADDAVTYINNLYNDSNVRNKFGLIKDNTTDENIRYAGKYVQNYVEFGNTGELWRIIGTFEVKTSDGDTEELVKIVRDEPFKDSEGTFVMSWDSSASNINYGYGINEWSQADLKNMLNTYYIGNSTICTYCNSYNQATCTNSCNNSITPINSIYTSMIESVVWNTGALEWNDDGITPLQAYNAERGTRKGKVCTQGDVWCNDTVTRTTEWEGKIGLMYPSDFGYAGGSTCANITDKNCGQNNWSTNEGRYWIISPLANSGGATGVWDVEVSAGIDDACLDYGARPALYLKSNVQIIGGDGSKNNPYKLS